jgi:PAS domain S-box-containing protein
MSIAVSAIPIGIIGGSQGFKYLSLIFIALIFLATFFVSFIISYIITHPLEKLTGNINEISKGKLDVTLSSSEIYEINNLTDSLNRVMASLKLAIHKVGVKKGEIFEDAVKAKETAEQRQKELFNNIKGWAWETDAKGVYMFCSKNISNFLGYSPDEIIGKNIFDFISSEDQKKSKQVFNEAAKKKQQIKNLENWNVHKNGTKICVVTNAVPFFDDNGNLLGYRGVDTDISNEKEYEIKINQLNSDISMLKSEINEPLNQGEKFKQNKERDITSEKTKIDEMWSEHEFDMVFIFDEKANILDCNENMYQKLGYTKNELLSLNLADIDALESIEKIKNKIIKAKEIGSITFKTINKRKDGSAILVQENLQYLKDKDKFKGIIREDYSQKNFLK